MICAALILTGSLIGLQDPAGKAATAADRITLRDGSVVLGLVTSVAAGPRGGVDLLVRRDWADKHVESWAKRWSRAIEQGTRLAVRQRRDRLRSWRRERAASISADDRIIAWIDEELKRLDDPARSARAPLLPVHLARTDVRSMARAPLASNRLLQLGWVCGLKEVETMPVDDLKTPSKAAASRPRASTRLPCLACCPRCRNPIYSGSPGVRPPSWRSIRTCVFFATRA